MIIRNEIAYPDATDTKRLWRIRVVFLVSLLSASLYFWSQLSSSIQDARQARFLILLIAVALGVIGLGIGAWTLYAFRRVVRSGQWPHPEATIDRPIPVVRGKAATNKAWVMLMIGSAFAVTLISVGAYLHFAIGARLEKLLAMA